VAPPAAAQDFRSITTRVISDTVSGMSDTRANPGDDQASGANRASSQQASRWEAPPAQTNAGQKRPGVLPPSPDGGGSLVP
jgi:hypothetical protein